MQRNDEREREREREGEEREGEMEETVGFFFYLWPEGKEKNGKNILRTVGPIFLFLFPRTKLAFGSFGRWG